MRKSHDTHGYGDTPLIPFLAMKKGGERVVRGEPIKSVKNSGGGIKDVNKHAECNILSHSLLKAEEEVGRQPKLRVAYLYIHHQK